MAGGNINIDGSRATVEKLLECFISGALGLTLKARIHDANCLPEGHRSCLASPDGKPRVWAAWYTDRGPVSVCAIYNHEQALRMDAHVLWIEWWITTLDHHAGWWRCDPKRPREWTKGLRVPPS